MRKFNLEEALAGKPVVTREGEKVTEIYYFKTDKGQYPVSAVVNSSRYGFTIKGEIIKHPNIEYGDLFMAEEEKEMCLVCNEVERKHPLNFYCEQCHDVNTDINLLRLAKRIKALEDK